MKYLVALGISASLLSALTPNAAMAKPYTYAPQHCDTQITFPEEPLIENRCMTKGDQKDCSDVVTFKKIFIPDGSVNVRVTCVAYDKKELDTYTPEVVEETLKRLLSDQNMEAYDVTSDSADGIRRSTSLSVGSQDNVPYVYTGQIWIGDKSMFTLEISMKGAKNDQVDKLFAEILSSTHAVKQSKPAAVSKDKKEATPETPAKKVEEPSKPQAE